jgi:exodeoxyribonuclease VII small subunit
MKKDTNLTYEEAVKELELLAAKIENPQTPLDTISGEVKKALELVKYCKGKLRDFETKIEELKE